MGCQQPKASKPDANTTQDRRDPPARQPAQEPPVKAEQARQAAEKKPPPPARAGSPAPRNGVPTPDNTCGHAIAFAGWRAGLDENSERILFFDPGDNGLEVGRHEHRWDAEPAESPVYFGKRRPAVVLEPAGAFTVCGAVVMTPQGGSKTSEPVESIADAMPDLSQVLGEKWPGLCGPTSAADIIYAIGSRRKALVDGLPRGPSPEANVAAAQLIVGVNSKVDNTSLAFRMGLRKDGKGVTNEGIRDGLAEWLANRDPRGWDVELDWLDDHEKAPEAQAEFFQRLESTTRSGGGVILCLWPGNEFTDGSTAEAAQRNAASAAASASNNASGHNGSSGPSTSSDGTPGSTPTNAAGRSVNRSATGRQARTQTGDPGADAPASGKEDGGDDGEPGSSSQGDANDKDSTVATAQQPSPSAPSVKGKGRGFAGNKADAQAVETALQKGLRAISRAQKAKANGDNVTALLALGEAISTLRPHAGANASCRKALATATELAVALDGGFPEQAPSINSPTSFE